MPRDDRSWMRLPRSSPEWLEKFPQFLDITFGGTSTGGTAACPCPRCVCMVYRPRSVVQIHLLNRGFDESFIREGERSDVVLHNEVMQPVDVEVHNDVPLPADVHVDNEATPPEAGVDNEEDAPSDDCGATNLVRSLIRGAIHGEIRDTNEQPNEHAKIFFKLLQEAEKELYPCCSDATKVSFIVQLFQLKCMYGISNRAWEGVLHLFSMFSQKATVSLTQWRKCKGWFEI